jgi:hypothetical protein
MNQDRELPRIENLTLPESLEYEQIIVTRDQTFRLSRHSQTKNMRIAGIAASIGGNQRWNEQGPVFAKNMLNLLHGLWRQFDFSMEIPADFSQKRFAQKQIVTDQT